MQETSYDELTAKNFLDESYNGVLFWVGSDKQDCNDTNHYFKKQNFSCTCGQYNKKNKIGDK